MDLQKGEIRFQKQRLHAALGELPKALMADVEACVPACQLSTAHCACITSLFAVTLDFSSTSGTCLRTCYLGACCLSSP